MIFSIDLFQLYWSCNCYEPNEQMEQANFLSSLTDVLFSFMGEILVKFHSEASITFYLSEYL